VERIERASTWSMEQADLVAIVTAHPEIDREESSPDRP
jgi:hypothetical protein